MTALFDRLVQASLEGSLLIAGVWLVCRLAPALPASFRVVLWWLAALKLLVGLAGIDPISLPILPASASAAVVTNATRPATNASSVAPVAPVAPVTPSTDWRRWATGTWLIAVGALFLVTLRQRHRTRRLIASAGPAEPQLLDVVDALAEQVGLVAPPYTLRADRVESPMVTGLFTPVVLLPRARFDALPDAQQRMAICHELVHLRRGDLWLGCVPALAERLFFFHPLAHVAAREYLLAREAACDAAVLRAMDATPQDYGRLLLALGVSPLRAGFAASSTSRSFSSLKRRIAMLNHTTPSTRARYTGWLLAAAAVVAIVPMQVVARTAPTPTHVEQDFSPAQQSPAQQSPAQQSPAQQSPALQSQAPQKVAQNVSALTADSVQVETRTSGSHPEFVLVLGENHTVMNGSADDRKISKIRRAGDHALWFKYQGKEYLTTDPAVLAEAEAIYRPVSQIGEQQGEIGAKQGVIGAQQGQVGADQGAIGARQGALGAQQGAIGAKQGAIGAKQSHNLSEAEQKQLDAEMAKLDKEMAELDEQMKELDKEMEKAGQPMAELDAKMKELDVQMQALDKQMNAASAKADAQMDGLIERLVKSGAAQEVR